MKAISLKNTEATEETVKIDELHETFVQNAIDELDDCCGDLEPEMIECYSRDGFIPHSHNHGGYSCHIICNIWSGGWNSEIQNQIDSTLDYVSELGKEEFGDSYDPCNNSEHGNWESECLSDINGDMFYIEARAMYHGLENGMHSTTFELIARVSDAPYFRYADSVAEITIEYKDAKDLESQLAKMNVLDQLTTYIARGEYKKAA